VASNVSIAGRDLGCPPPVYHSLRGSPRFG
jgi:hypothetical protein